ncbi:phosphate ABC transporter substrate-binding protein [Methyloceanibacter marginalis]|jgi:phosphate transport system substrate-binding protein|nr:phosphate ABC transporter substrate-binding protein [Methyloceanibacter marginalis]
MRILRNPMGIGAAAAVLCLLGFGGDSLAQSSNDSLRVGGSTTLVPSVVNAASTFMETFETWDKASSALPGEPTIIYVTGGGSGFGVKSATNGTVDIGMASRDLKDKEKSALGTFEAVLVGKDAVAIAANVDNPLAKTRKNLTTEEVRKLFSGELKTYKDIDASLPDEEIVLLVRDASAGSAEIFQEKIMGDAAVSSGALQMPSQGALMKKLESNASALAYMSSGLATENDGIQTFALDGVEPTNANVVKGAYPLARPLLMIVKGAPNPMAKRFLDYMLAEGQTDVASQGYVPVHEVQ